MVQLYGAAQKDIKVTHNDYNGVYLVDDNNNPDGYLNNGKPITGENVIELLNKAETIWTHGMIWTYG